MGLAKLKKPEPKIESVLGIDCSTQSVAFCLYDKSGPVRWGEIKFKGSNVFERIADGQAKVGTALKDLNPDLIIFESAVYIQNKKTVVLLAYAYGAIIASLMRPGVPVEEISPLVWQPLIGNPRFTKEEKEQVKKDNPDMRKAWYDNHMRSLRKQRTMDWVDKTFSITTNNDNVGDAIAIAHVGYDKFHS